MAVAQLSSSLYTSIRDVCAVSSPARTQAISRLPPSNSARISSTFTTGSPLGKFSNSPKTWIAASQLQSVNVSLGGLTSDCFYSNMVLESEYLFICWNWKLGQFFLLLSACPQIDIVLFIHTNELKSVLGNSNLKIWNYNCFELKWLAPFQALEWKFTKASLVFVGTSRICSSATHEYRLQLFGASVIELFIRVVIRVATPQRTHSSRATSVSIRCEQSTEDGNGLDVWLGRIAMIGFASAITVEVATGKGLLENFGLTSPLPTVALAVTALVGVLTAIFIFQSASDN